MTEHIRPAVAMLLLFTALTGIAYPLAITGIAQLSINVPANGSLVARDGKTVGSVLIGQSFTSDRYFHGRPSATSAPDPKDDTKTVDAPYNAANSSGSNLGPTSAKLIDRVKADVASLKSESGRDTIPADAVTASGSGLDPHVSPAFAKLQVPRVAKARRISEEALRRLLAETIEQPDFGFLGEPRVNVLRLNLALDQVAGGALSSR